MQEQKHVRPNQRYVFGFLRPKPGQAKQKPKRRPLLAFEKRERAARQSYVYWFLRPRAKAPAEAPPQTPPPVLQPAPVEPAVELEPVLREELPPVEPEQLEEAAVEAPEPVAEVALEEPVDFFARIRAGLGKTRDQLVQGLGAIFTSGALDEDLLEELETQLLMADTGIDATTAIVDAVRDRASEERASEPEALRAIVKQELARVLAASDAPLNVEGAGKPFVILVVGVNGVGKTTTIGKLACRLKAEGRSVMLAAGDTFRAAAVEQLQVWGERNGVPVVAQHSGADSASVIFDAVESAQAKGVDVVIADTAGRLHNKDHLMDELSKVVRVMGKLDASAPHEVLLVLDAGTGQNALSQARAFQEAVQVSGIAMTKLDGTAKGGILFAVARQLAIPIRFIGVGEGIEDLRPFVADEFVRALID